MAIERASMSPRPNTHAAPLVSYSITVRLDVPAGGRTASVLTTAVEHAGGVITALELTAAAHERLRIDVTCAGRDTEHANMLVAVIEQVEGVVVGQVSDPTFLVHLGGMIEVQTKHPIRD